MNLQVGFRGLGLRGIHFGPTALLNTHFATSVCLEADGSWGFAQNSHNATSFSNRELKRAGVHPLCWLGFRVFAV